MIALSCCSDKITGRVCYDVILIMMPYHSVATHDARLHGVLSHHLSHWLTGTSRFTLNAIISRGSWHGPGTTRKGRGGRRFERIERYACGFAYVSFGTRRVVDSTS